MRTTNKITVKAPGKGRQAEKKALFLFLQRWTLLPLLLLAVLPAAAQENYGAISISIDDKDGVPIPGVELTLSSPVLPKPVVLNTNDSGKAYLKGLPPGLYQLKASLNGFQDRIFNDIRVNVGGVAKLDFVLELSPASEIIAVTGKAPVLDMRKTSSSRSYHSHPDAPPARTAKVSSLRLPSGPFNTREFTSQEENIFKKPVREPLSTFSIDVDTASYSIIRRIIREDGQLPDPSAIRAEELLNYFPCSSPAPDYKKSKVPFSVTTETGPCPWKKNHLLTHISIKGVKIPKEELPPSNLVFLIDVSGSMSSPDKLPLLLDAFRLLTMELEDRDIVSIVVYAGSSGLVLPPTRGNEKNVILSALGRLSAGGSTAGGAGIQLAYNTACAHFIPTGNNRVILATDGDFNVGVSSTGELVRIIEEKRKTGVFLTVLGFGMDNLKDARMEQLADKGNGNYFYIDSLREGKKVLVSGLQSNFHTIAKDVKIQVEFNPAYVEKYRLIGYENRKLENEDFENDQKDAGELGPGHSVTALYEIIPVKHKSRSQTSELKYSHMIIKNEALDNCELMTVKLRYKLPKEEESRLISTVVKAGGHDLDACSHDFRFASAVAEWSLLLRNSRFKGAANFNSILSRLEKVVKSDESGIRSEFAELVKLTQRIDSDN